MDHGAPGAMRGQDVGEVNFDGLPGPTHNYAGLAEGNLAAARHASEISNPREAALQGLAKMRALATRGWPQAVLPPQPRPDVATLRSLGFGGTDADVVRRAAREAPPLLAACTSAAAMWVANAATVTPGTDSGDGRVHFTPANLAHHLHRAIEAPVTTTILRAIFADPAHFVVHDPLPGVPQLGDEGAANATRLVSPGARHGIAFMVYGRRAFGAGAAPGRFGARQTREASLAIARRHGIAPGRLVTAQQLPEAIDAGVFHNDVIAVGHGNVLFCHARAFVDPPAVLDALRRALPDLVAIVVPDALVSLEEAVATYLFNSQLLTREDGRLVLVAPEECMVHPRVRAYLDALLAQGGPVAEVMPLDLRQSMRNGGGPACLRLRVPLAPVERHALRGRVMADGALCDILEQWVRRHYRDRLAPADLGDPALLDESNRALDELTGILRLPSLYAFQRAGA